MDAAGQLVRKNIRDHAVAVEAGPPFEDRCDNLDAEMGLAAGTRAGMTLVAGRVINDLQPGRR